MGCVVGLPCLPSSPVGLPWSPVCATSPPVSDAESRLDSAAAGWVGTAGEESACPVAAGSGPREARSSRRAAHPLACRSRSGACRWSGPCSWPNRWRWAGSARSRSWDWRAWRWRRIAAAGSLGWRWRWVGRSRSRSWASPVWLGSRGSSGLANRRPTGAAPAWTGCWVGCRAGSDWRQGSRPVLLLVRGRLVAFGALRLVGLGRAGLPGGEFAGLFGVSDPGFSPVASFGLPVRWESGFPVGFVGESLGLADESPAFLLWAPVASFLVWSPGALGCRTGSDGRTSRRLSCSRRRSRPSWSGRLGRWAGCRAGSDGRTSRRLSCSGRRSRPSWSGRLGRWAGCRAGSDGRTSRRLSCSGRRRVLLGLVA